MKFQGMIAGIGLIVILSMATCTSWGSAIETEPVNDEELKKLQQERIEVLREIQKHSQVLEQKGLASSSDVFGAMIAVERAMQDAATTDRERLDSLKRIIKIYEQEFAKSEAGYRVGANSFQELMSNKANVLGARVEHEKLKLKIAGE